MKLKIVSLVLLIVVGFSLFYLIKFSSVDNPIADTGEENPAETNENPDSEITKAFVIKAGHDVDTVIERLAYGDNKEYKNSLSDLSARLSQSAEFLRTEANDPYGSAYFSKLSEIFSAASGMNYASASEFSSAVSSFLSEIDNAFPAEEAKSAAGSGEDAMYYPVIDTANDGAFSLAMISAYQMSLRKEGSITLSFGGNIFIGDTVLGQEADDSFKNAAEKEKNAYPFYKLSPALMTDTLSFANLCSPFTESVEAVGIAGSLKALPSHAPLLLRGGIEGLTLSDTNLNSYGDVGKSDTVSALDGANISHADENQIAFIDTEIGKVALITFDLTDESLKTDAITEAPKAAIAEARTNGAKIVVVHFNWQNTCRDFYDPSKMQVNTARGAIDSGADVVFATHPENLECIEEYNGKKILYSTGTLLNKNSAVSESLIFSIEFSLNESGNAVQGKTTVFPVKIKGTGDGVPTLILNSNEVNNFKNNLVKYSSTARYGLNKRDNFTLNNLEIFSISK